MISAVMGTGGKRHQKRRKLVGKGGGIPAGIEIQRADGFHAHIARADFVPDGVIHAKARREIQRDLA